MDQDKISDEKYQMDQYRIIITYFVEHYLVILLVSITYCEYVPLNKIRFGFVASRTLLVSKHIRFSL
jgi:hypothetical protein